MKRAGYLVFFFLTLFLIPRAQDLADSSRLPVSLADFSRSSPIVKPGVGAVVLNDLGEASLSYEDNGWTVTYSCFRRLRVLDKNGLDACTVSLGFSADDNRNRKLKSLKAATYNLNGTQIEKTDLDPKQIFLEKEKHGDQVVEKFAMPNARKGSVIEYSYTIKSTYLFPFYPWQFQDIYPVLNSRFTAVIPALFNYAIIPHGDLSSAVKTTRSETKDLWVGYGRSSVDVYSITWQMKDIDLMPDEPFVFNNNASIAGIEFQLSAIPDGSLKQVAYMRTWPVIANRLLRSPEYAAAFGKPRRELQQMSERLGTGAKSPAEKAEHIYRFVRDSLHVYNFSDVPVRTPAETLKSRGGNAADLHLLLATLLDYAGIPAKTVMLATRAHDPLSPEYPVWQNVNRLIVRATPGKQSFFLDCAHPGLPFGELLPSYYNGVAIVVEPTATAVYLDVDSLIETRKTEMTAKIDDSGRVRAEVDVYPGAKETYEIKKLLRDSASRLFTLSDLEKESGLLKKLPVTVRRSVLQPDSDIAVHYEMEIETSGEKRIYLNGLLNHQISNNPFPAGKRFNPVHFDHPFENDFTIDVDVAPGWTIESLPRSARVRVNDKEGIFEYLVSGKDNHYSIHYLLRVIRARFAVEDYEALRNFYSAIISQESQMVVLKRK